MGLDIYLHDGEDISPSYPENGTEDERRAYFEASRAYYAKTDAKSERFPEHVSGPRYLRSSYNDGGFNSVVGNLIGKDLYWIFEYEEGKEEPYDEETETGGDWFITRDQLTAARERAVQARDELAAVKVPLAAFSVSPVVPSTLNDRAAIKLVTEQLERPRDERSFRSYSNRDGHFYLDGIEILGLIPGRDVLGRECTHVVHKLDVKYYLDTCEIIIEFIDTALAMERPRVVWSG